MGTPVHFRLSVRDQCARGRHVDHRRSFSRWTCASSAFSPGCRWPRCIVFSALAWAGFGINFLSGVALFSAQATSFAVDGTFQLKIGLVLLGSITAALLQTAVGRDSAAWATTVPLNVRIVAIASILLWVGAIVTGRLTAYL